ncbi:MAG: flagellar basal body rod protein FlgC [Spirochaetaceae bacterium]|nr:flagellar basal body rod protein FlgC [Spirochaetaceae bacterium]
MGLFNSINIAGTGLTAQRMRSDVIADNIANVNSTRRSDGGMFQRGRVILKPRGAEPYWRSPFLPEGMNQGERKGVRVAEIEKDDSPPRRVWDPTHPDALKTGEWEGYVEYANIDIVIEMTDMIDATRAYEANAQVIEGSKAMFQRALDIGGSAR